MLSNLKNGLSKKDIISVLQDNSLANYFESTDAFSELVKKDNIYCIDHQNQLFTVTNSGKLIADQLETYLPASVREQVINASLSLIATAKRQRENSVDIKKLENGYTVKCHISGGDLELMSINLYAPDLIQANVIKSNFQKNPELIYDCMIALMTDNKELLKNSLEKI